MQLLQLREAPPAHEVDHERRHAHGHQQQTHKNDDGRGEHQHDEGRKHRAQAAEADALQPAQQGLHEVEGLEPGGNGGHRAVPEEIAQAEGEHHHQQQRQQRQCDHHGVQAIRDGTPEGVEHGSHGSKNTRTALPPRPLGCAHEPDQCAWGAPGGRAHPR